MSSSTLGRPGKTPSWPIAVTGCGSITPCSASCPSRAAGSACRARRRRRSRPPRRSEEHTSELQSRQYLVCRLLLEKKKKKIPQDHYATFTSSQVAYPLVHPYRLVAFQ